MRSKKQFIASPDQVKISRDRIYAIIDYADPDVGQCRIQIGPKVATMTDVEILDLHNSILIVQEEMVSTHEHVAVEIPPGKPQIEYFEQGNQWTPRGGVLRCHISGGGPNLEAIIHIDDKDLSLQEFGKLLTVYAGWGMRITFIPEDDVYEEPKIEVREPDKD